MDNILKTHDISIPLESMLHQQIYNALEGDILTKIIKEAKVGKSDRYFRNLLEGHSFKVEEKISKRLHQLCDEVKGKLNYSNPIDFYITRSSEVNAFAISSLEEGEPDIININSALLQLMTDDEIKFVIGHEIGHLLSKNSELYKLLFFVYPNPANRPPFLEFKINLWDQLSELIADRYGYLATQNLETCISSFFKMTSGLSTQMVDLDYHEFLKENDKRLEYFRQDHGLNVSTTHPINPVRVKAVELFSIYSLKDQFQVDEFQKQMDDIIEILLKIKSSELDNHRSYFLASAGLIIASLDGEVDEKEIERLTYTLSNFEIFPSNFIQHIHQSGKVNEIFFSSIKNILEINPAEREIMVIFMIEMILSDKKIKDSELSFIFEVGEKAFGYTRKEVAQIFAQKIQEQFAPRILDLS